MTERTALFVLDPDGAHACWYRDGRAQRGTLAELAALRGADWVWIVDGRRVQLTEVELPPGRRRVQEQALPFALEDQLLSPLDALAFATRRLTPTRYAAAVFDAAELGATLDALADAGVAVARCVPDVLCVPWEPGSMTLVFAGDDVWLRSGPYAGARCARAQWRAFVEQARVAAGDGLRLRVYGGDEAQRAALAALAPDLEIESVATPGEGPALFAAGLAQGSALDLLAALPRRRAAQAGSARRWWAATLALVFVAALAHAGFLRWRVHALEELRTRELARTEALFRSMFPQITRIEDVRAQAAQELAARAQAAPRAAQFLDLFATAGETLAAQGELRFDGASYGNGALELRVRAPDMAALERYQQALAATLPVELLSVEKRDAAAVGLLRVGQSP